MYRCIDSPKIVSFHKKKRLIIFLFLTRSPQGIQTTEREKILKEREKKRLVSGRDETTYTKEEYWKRMVRFLS
jgi:hypothetical protein